MNSELVSLQVCPRSAAAFRLGRGKSHSRSGPLVRICLPCVQPLMKSCFCQEFGKSPGFCPVGFEPWMGVGRERESKCCMILFTDDNVWSLLAQRGFLQKLLQLAGHAGCWGVTGVIWDSVSIYLSVKWVYIGNIGLIHSSWAPSDYSQKGLMCPVPEGAGAICPFLSLLPTSPPP